MTEAEGLQLLHVQETDIVNGKQVLTMLGHLPLAIDQARAYIQARNLSLQDFMAHYRQRRELILKSTPLLSNYQRTLEDGQGRVVLSVFTTWEMSLGQLHAAGHQQSLEEFLMLSAFFDPSHINEGLFRIYAAQASRTPSYLMDFLTDGNLKYSYIIIPT